MKASFETKSFSPSYRPSINIATGTNNTALVDIKLLEALFKNYQPATLDIVKERIKAFIDNSESLAGMHEAVSNELIILEGATKFYNLTHSKEDI